MKTCEYGVYNPYTDEVEPCGNIVEGSTEMCASHNAFFRKLKKQNEKSISKRAQMIEKQKAKNSIPRKKPNAVSEKRKEINEEYFKLVEQFKKDNPECKANVNDFCTKHTDHPHHKRGRTGDNLMDVATWFPVCASCHSYIEAHPKEAKEKGWSESRLATEPKTI